MPPGAERKYRSGNKDRIIGALVIEWGLVETCGL